MASSSSVPKIPANFSLLSKYYETIYNWLFSAVSKVVTECNLMSKQITLQAVPHSRMANYAKHRLC